MNRLITVLRELVGLVVDDATLAAAAAIWVAVVWLLVSHAGLPAAWGGPALFVGLAAILIESALRRART